MNEAETRAEHIDPALAAAGWGVVEGSRILREYPIAPGRIEGHGRRARSHHADYVLVYRNRKLAVTEAKLPPLVRNPLRLALVVAAVVAGCRISTVATPHLAAGTLAESWYAGGPECRAAPAFQVHAYNADTFILRQSACTNYEKPFLYLIFGSSTALLLDTGAGNVDVVSPVDTLIRAWSARHLNTPVELVVAHSHAHGDHVAGDTLFAKRAHTTVVGRDSAQVRAFFGIARWPADSGTFDLGDRVIDILPIPGHQPASIALYDRRTGILLTGDTFYPGRLYVRDTLAFARSIDRLAAFARGHTVTHFLGAHIEQMDTPYEDYPVGTVDQPNEHGLDLTRAALMELDSAVTAMRGRFVRTRLRSVTIWPLMP